MKILKSPIPYLFCLIWLIFTVITTSSVYSQGLTIEAETGGLWFSHNDVRIPNEGGTDFDMIDLIGSDAVPFYRLRLNIIFNERHTLRLLFAPLSKIGSGSFDEPVLFEETQFEADTPIDGSYKFNTYRLNTGYRVLEGGADVDEVFNFAWINYVLFGVKVDL